MEKILALIIVILGIWELLIYIRFVRLRSLLEKTIEAIERYISRRWEIIGELKSLMISLEYFDVDILNNVLKIIEKYSVNIDFKEKLNIDSTIGEEFNEKVLSQTENSSLVDDQEYFYLKDEFLELGKVISQCIELYNLTTVNFNKRVLSYPDRAVALLLRIKEKDTI